MSTKDEKPTALKVIPENIPDELKKHNHWTFWNYNYLPNQDRWDKPPLKPDGCAASTANPREWSTFDRVLKSKDKFDGVGFVLTEDLHLVGIDIDKLNQYPEIVQKEILADVAALDTYYEKSPSGNGIRAFVYASIDLSDNNKAAPFEIYNTRKVLSITGQRIGTQTAIARAPKAFYKFYKKWVLDRKSVTETAQKGKGDCEPGKWKPSPKMTDEEVLNHLKKATNNEKFFVLYSAGDWGKYYSSHSEGDAALCSLIAFYTQDWNQIDRVFRTSALYRADKWGDREDYRERTQNWVFSHLTATYQPSETKKATKKKNSENKESEVPEHIQQLIEEAKQCEEKGSDACKAWVKENAVQLACTDRTVWKMMIDYDRALKEFVESYPQAMNDVKAAFELDEFDAATIHNTLDGYNALYNSEKSRHVEIKNRLDKYSDEVIDKAVNELQHGDPYRFVFNAWKKQHVGDEPLGRSLAVCATSTLVAEENDGLHFKPSGESGKGKTSGIDAFLNLLPPSMVVRGGISDKYIYYAENEIKDGSIIFMDDRLLSENLKGVVKNSISNFRNPESHRTVIDGKAVTYKPAKRMVWVFASVDGFDDEQLANRFLMTDVDSSEEQDIAVAIHQGNREIERLLGNHHFETDVCQCMFSLLSLKTYDVVVPFQQEIAAQWNHKRNRRNQPKFRDIIKAVCVYKIFQRQHVKECTIATYDDLLRAITVYGSTAKQNSTNLTADEDAVINYLLNKNLEDDDFRKAKTQEEKRQYAHRAGLHEIAEALGKKDNAVRRILLGRLETHSPGLDSKIQHFHYEKDGESANRFVFFYSGEHNFEQYTAFCGNISPEEVDELTSDFIQKYQAITTNTQKTEEMIKNQAFQEAIKSLPSRCIQLFQTFPDFSRGMEKLENNNGSNKNKANIRDFSNFSRIERECNEFCDFDCKELGSEQFNFLQSKTENIEKRGRNLAISGKVSQISTENESADIDFQLFQGLEMSGKVWKSQATVTGKLDPIQQEIEYSQKSEFTITPENQQLHEENLHQLQLLTDPTELDRFYHYVDGIDICKLLSNEEESRIKGFEEDCLKLAPNADSEEKQRLFNIHDWIFRTCNRYEEPLNMEKLLEKSHHKDDGYIRFFGESMRNRGEIQLCTNSA